MTDEAKKPAKLGKETVYIDVEDDITSIIDKVDNAKEKVVALVLPKRASALQSIVNMRLLKRSADKASKNVVLITGELALLPLAGAAGLHVASSLNSNPAVPPAPNKDAVPKAGVAGKDEEVVDVEDLPNKIDYDSSIGALAEAHEIEHPETIELGDNEGEVAAAKATEKIPKVKRDRRLKVPNFDRFRLWLILSIAGGIALIVFIILALSVLPKATISIQTTSQPVSANLNMTTSGAATTLDESKEIVPSFSKTSDQTGQQQTNATGQQNNGTKASGTMVFYNCNQSDTLSGTDHVVPAGTGVSTGGLTYITQTSTTVSPSHFNGSTCKSDVPSSSVNVVSQVAGSKYNQDATTYAVSGYSTITGNGSKMTGGTDNIQTIVSQSDVDGVTQKIISGSTASTFTQSFENQLASQGYYVFVSTMKAGDPTITANPAVGQPASSTVVNAKVTYSVLAVKRDVLVKAISDALVSQIDKTKQKVDASDILKDASITVSNQSSPTNATLSIVINTSAVPILDTASIQKQAKGQKTADITASISNIPGVKDVSVKLSPFWVSKAPNKTSKIIVKVQHVNQ